MAGLALFLVLRNHLRVNTWNSDYTIYGVMLAIPPGCSAEQQVFGFTRLLTFASCHMGLGRNFFSLCCYRGQIKGFFLLRLEIFDRGITMLLLGL